MFSVPLLRSHATASLVDRDRLQLYHANRSVILVSSAIDFSKGDGKDKFIATIIAFHCLSFEQNGILTNEVPKNADLLSRAEFPTDAQVVQKGHELHFAGNKTYPPFKATLGNVISRDPAMIGRSTVVLTAKVVPKEDKEDKEDKKAVKKAVKKEDKKDKEKDQEGPIVVKISWPTSGRISETAFLKTATDMAKGEHAWAANHLPKVYYAEDVVFDRDSTLHSVARLFQNAQVVNGKFKYEPRTLRIIIQERLHPLKSLSNVRDIGQAFLDVACGMCFSLPHFYTLTPVQFTVGSTTSLGSSTATSV